MTRKEFYRSKQWRQLSRAVLLSRNYICEVCGAPAAVVHHKVFLTAANVDDPEISLNPDLLQCLCLECHNAVHFGAGGAVAAGYIFDEHGDIIPVTGEGN